MRINTTGIYNVAVGQQALYNNTTANDSTAVGYQAGYAQTTATRSTLIGSGAGNSITTGNENTIVGYQAGISVTTGSRNVFIGRGGSGTGSATTGSNNTFVGGGAGSAVTTGGENTIIGQYTGNQGGLDIRTSSNYIVLSDGDGNPRGIFDSSGNLLVGKTSIGLSTTGIDLRSNGLLQAIRDGGTVVELNRQTSDGTIIDLRKDNTTVGEIGVSSSGTDLYIGNDDVGLRFSNGGNYITPYNVTTQADSNGGFDLGYNSGRFKDIYLSGGVQYGGTSPNNNLDDYEEGAWTPSLEGSTGALTSITYVSRDGHYRKIGDTVIVWWDMQQTNISGGSGSIQIPLSDLPFAPSFSLSGGREIATGAAQTYLVPWPHDGTIGTRLEPSEGIQFQISRNNGTWSTITTGNASGSAKYWGGHLIYRTTSN
jgi:hypothetical protein